MSGSRVGVIGVQSTSARLLAIGGLAGITGSLILVVGLSINALSPDAASAQPLQTLGFVGFALLAACPFAIAPALLVRHRERGIVASAILLVIAVVASYAAVTNALTRGYDVVVGLVFIGGLAWYLLTPLVVVLASVTRLLPRPPAFALSAISVLGFFAGNAGDPVRSLGQLAYLGAWLTVSIAMLRSGIQMPAQVTRLR